VGVQTTKNRELDAKALWKNTSFVNIYPVSKGTWSVRAHTGGKNKQFTGLSFEEIPSALIEAFSWLDDQVQ
jgi:hypothetical protein